MIVSVGFLLRGCAGGKGGRRPPMPRRGEEKKHHSHFKEVVAQNVAQKPPDHAQRTQRLPTTARLTYCNLLILRVPTVESCHGRGREFESRRPRHHSKEVKNRWRFPHRCKKVHLFPSSSSLL